MRNLTMILAMKLLIIGVNEVTNDHITSDMLYNPIKEEEATIYMNRLQGVIDSFLKKSSLDRSDISVNDALLLKTIVRIDQRSDYFTYFHSEIDENGNIIVDRMSQYKQIALLCFWIIKYKPLRIDDPIKELSYYDQNHCTVNEAFAAYIFISQINSSNIVSNKQKNYYKSVEFTQDLFYKFMHHDISKEAMIFALCSIICNK